MVTDVLGILEEADAGSFAVRTSDGELVVVPVGRALGGKVVPPPPSPPPRCWTTASLRRCGDRARTGTNTAPTAILDRLRDGRRRALSPAPAESGVRPVSRHQPRAMPVVAGSLMVETVRSDPVRRA